jgi:hypothetical protein
VGGRSFAAAAVCLLSAVLANLGRADTLSSESSVGVSGEYASNPYLLRDHVQAAESIAVIANVPATYTSDTQIINLIPRVRFAETHGPVALLSDYQYLDGDYLWTGERNTFNATAQLHHDSTLYNEFENAALNGASLRRLEDAATVSYRRELDERSSLQLNGSWDQVRYNKNFPASVIDYSYLQGGLQYDRKLSEHWLWSNSLGYGLYRLPDGAYTSEQRFAQSTFKGTLTERWSMTVGAGYSYLTNHTHGYIYEAVEIAPGFFVCCALVPVAESASHGAPNYALSFERRNARLVLDLTASRAVQPTGFGALLTQDDISLGASYPSTERLTVGATAHWSRLIDPLHQLDLSGRHYYQFVANANWQWTEHWTLQLQASYLQQYLSSQAPGTWGVIVYVNLLRQFGRVRL